MAVRIRMKRMGKKHRPFYRICTVDSRSPRDGKVIEILGTYDPMVPDTDARVVLNHERLSYWLSVGAKPSEHVAAFVKKYGPEGSHLDQQKAARERLAMPRIVPPAPPAVYKPEVKPPVAEPAAVEAAAPESAPSAPAETASE